MPATQVVFIPGLGFGPELFAFQTAHLGDVGSCHFAEMRHADIDSQVAETLSAVDGEFALVAHSGGTLAAIATAAAASHRVTHLVLQGTMGKVLPPVAGFLDGMIADLEAGKLESCRDQVRKVALGVGHPDQAAIEEQVIDSQRQVGTDRFVTQCRFIRDNMDQRAALRAITARTLFVHAREDGFFDLDLTRELAGHVPHSRLVVLEDSGHLAAVEQPQALTALVHLWLES